VVIFKAAKKDPMSHRLDLESLLITPIQVMGWVLR
jgi:hypothetical protein